MERWIGSLLLISFLAAMGSSCHKRQVLVPAATPAPAPAAPANVAPQPAPSVVTPTEEIPPPPAIAPSAPAPQDQSVIPNPPTPPPPKQPRRNSRPNPPPQTAPAPTTPSAPSTPTPSTPAPSTPASATPQLGIVLTPEQQRQYNSDIDQSLQRAESNLRSIGNRQLTKEQRSTLEEARNFIRQAQATRTSDLPGAKRLADRADVLSGNLAASLR